MSHRIINLVSYQPIENYGIIGDLNTIALIGLNGSIDFMCFPRFDSPSVFAALLDDKKGGSYSISPEFKKMKTKQLYLPDTNVLLTRFLSSEGVGEVIDFMPVDPKRRRKAIRRVTTIRERGEIRVAMFSPDLNTQKRDIQLSGSVIRRSYFGWMATMDYR